ncbi:PTS mannitol transporter subunit IIBC [Izhakiella australiensis]|uniref:protein-N(pi)-phosphohistidine--D-mannitol phosphotransferase n=1 Tax=Izhakiella australiensis TaxID=1926881 RepID=A0A1S8YPM5_9GAMM|nr:PTS mannitol transporter subunit IICB [Izhakiella australiensis]OON41089.1 PTS mannitol transporter subunit IIBC [Izhakiella australiensis]
MATQQITGADNGPGFLVKVQRFGNFLSGMVMPNLGVFVAWGLLTALFIPTGWLPNPHLGALVSPILTYLLPLLVGFTGGYIVHGQRGGALGALATMGLIIGSDVTMLSGAMVIGPTAAWIMKKVDNYLEGKFRAGFEMLISNFSMGIIGLLITLLGYLIIGPIIEFLIHVLSAGVNWTISHKVLPLISIFVAPAQVLFLNNAINHGIMAPLGLEQVAETGKSVLFLVDANCGPSVGTLLAISLFGKGMAKKTAPTAALIAGVGGIGEVYFPFVLMKPVLVFATMAGITTSLSCFLMLGGGTVATPSPGSFIALLMLTPKGAMVGNLVGFFAGMLVSFLVASVILKLDRSQAAEEEPGELAADVAATSGVAIIVPEATQPLKRIIVACDAGMGSSAMGASILRNKLRKAMLDVEVNNSQIEAIPGGADLIVTHTRLIDRAKKLHDDGRVQFIAIENFMEAKTWDAIVGMVKQRRENS